MCRYASFALRIGLLGLFLLTGTIALAQEVKEPTRLDIKIVASTQTNLDANGRPAPIKVRIYELKDSNSFEEADYFSLNNDDKAVLGATLLARDEFILQPGEIRNITRKSNPQITVIGVLAGYRDLKNTWRTVYRLPEAPVASWYRLILPSNKSELIVQLDAQGVLINPAP